MDDTLRSLLSPYAATVRQRLEQSDSLDAFVQELDVLLVSSLDRAQSTRYTRPISIAVADA